MNWVMITAAALQTYSHPQPSLVSPRCQVQATRFSFGVHFYDPSSILYKNRESHILFNFLYSGAPLGNQCQKHILSYACASLLPECVVRSEDSVRFVKPVAAPLELCSEARSRCSHSSPSADILADGLFRVMLGQFEMDKSFKLV
jgi:hypothetical protein